MNPATTIALYGISLRDARSLSLSTTITHHDRGHHHPYSWPEEDFHLLALIYQHAERWSCLVLQQGLVVKPQV